MSAVSAPGSSASGSATGSRTVVVVSAAVAPGSSAVSGSATGSRTVVVVSAAVAPGFSAVSGSATGSRTVVVVSAAVAPGSSAVSGSATGSRTVVVVSAAVAPGSSAVSGSAIGATDVRGATDLTVVSEVPHAAVIEHSTIRNPSTLVTALGRYISASGSRGQPVNVIGGLTTLRDPPARIGECPVEVRCSARSEQLVDATPGPGLPRASRTREISVSGVSWSLGAHRIRSVRSPATMATTNT